MAVQVMPEADATTYRFNPFDLTKVWPHGDYPLIDVGILELDRNPDNYFAEVEQSAFNPANVVPGIGYSPDRMLQGRLFSYGDTHRYRLGINHDQLPVNRPRCPYHTPHRDGSMRGDDNGGLLPGGAAVPNYQPNSFGGPVDAPAVAEPPLAEAFGGTVARYDHREDEDYYSQPGALFRLFTADEKARLFANIAASIGSVPEAIQRRQIAHFTKADPAYGAGVAQALGLAI